MLHEYHIYSIYRAPGNNIFFSLLFYMHVAAIMNSEYCIKVLKVEQELTFAVCGFTISALC